MKKSEKKKEKGKKLKYLISKLDQKRSNGVKISKFTCIMSKWCE